MDRHDVGTLEALLLAGLDVNISKICLERGEITLLGYAIRRGKSRNAEVVKLLLKYGDPNNLVRRKSGWEACPRETALVAAIDIDSIGVLELLLDHGVVIDRPARLCLTRTPLQNAAEKGNIHIVHLLLSRGANANEAPSERGVATALQLAAMNGFLATVYELLNHGANVHAPRGDSGRTAFEIAAEYARLHVF